MRIKKMVGGSGVRGEREIPPFKLGERKTTFFKKIPGVKYPDSNHSTERTAFLHE